MEFIDNSTPSPKKNIAEEINSLKDSIEHDFEKIKEYKITINNLNSQKHLQEYLDMLEYYEERRNDNLALLKTRIKDLINHPLNKISPKSPSKNKRKRSHSRSQSRSRQRSRLGGTKKHRKKNKKNILI
jgi:hypothetical protein